MRFLLACALLATGVVAHAEFFGADSYRCTAMTPFGLVEIVKAANQNDVTMKFPGLAGVRTFKGEGVYYDADRSGNFPQTRLFDKTGMIFNIDMSPIGVKAGVKTQLAGVLSIPNFAVVPNLSFFNQFFPFGSSFGFPVAVLPITVGVTPLALLNCEVLFNPEKACSTRMESK